MWITIARDSKSEHPFYPVGQFPRICAGHSFSLFLLAGRFCDACFLNQSTVFTSGCDRTNAGHPAGLFKGILIDSNLPITCWHSWSFIIALVAPMTKNFDLFPDDWHHANVIPVTKAPRTTELNIFRPTSLTSFVNKVLEAILKGKMLAHLSQFSLLRVWFPPPTLNPDRPSRGKRIDYKMARQRECSWPDLSRPSLKPLARLRGYTIAPIVINCWIVECFLSRRLFRVNFSGTLTRPAEAISGVPQCSAINANDLPNQLSPDSLLYADDVKHIAPRNRQDILQNYLNASASWSKDWGLDFNPTKSEHFPTGNSPHFVANSLPSHNPPHALTIPKVSSTKDLRIILNTRVSAEDNVVSTANKACRVLIYLKRPFVAPTSSICLPLYTIFVQAHLEHAIQESHSIPRRGGIGKGADTRADARQMASARPV